MKDGWYWIRNKGESERWVICEFYAGSFFFHYSDFCLDIDEVEVGDYIETPDKYKE